MSCLLAFHEAVDGAVEPWRPALWEIGDGSTPRADLIRRGLCELGARPTACPAAGRSLPSLGEALGWLYVAEGSMLGGRVMRRSMVADAVPLAGLDFLDPYGEETGARWRAFLTAMDTACASGRAAPADVVKGGRDAFDLASRLLLNRARAELAS